MLLVVVTVPPLVALGLWAVDRNRQALTVDAQHYHRALAERARDAIEADVAGAKTTLDAITAVLADSAPLDDEARFALVQSWLRGWGRAGFVSLYGPDGALKGSVRLASAAGAQPPRSLPRALRGGTFTTGAVLSRDGEVVLQLSTPALREGEVTPAFWTYVELPLAPLADLVSRLGEAPPLRNRDAVFVVDADRTLRLSAEPKTAGTSLATHGLYGSLAGAPSFRQPLSVSLDFEEGGEPFLGALATVPSLGWAVVVQRPAAQAYATLGALKLAVVAAVVLAVLLSLAVGVVGARRLTRPLQRLTDAAKRMGERAWGTVDRSVSARGDEVGTLGRAFDAMSKDLEDSESALIRATQARAALSRYLSADVVEAVLKDPAALKLGGERKTVTVLFADVVGFTRLSETLPPETIVAILNELFTFATEIVHQQGGIIDKFIGDCVMAVWGVPAEKPDDARRAVAAAEALRRWLDVGNRRWKQRYGVELQLAIGVHTGTAVAGNLGSEKRMDYTVIGDAVNVAARLEASAAPDQILVSASTRDAIGDGAALAPLGERNLRGRSQTTQVYEVPR